MALAINYKSILQKIWTLTLAYKELLTMQLYSCTVYSEIPCNLNGFILSRVIPDGRQSTVCMFQNQALKSTYRVCTNGLHQLCGHTMMFTEQSQIGRAHV